MDNNIVLNIPIRWYNKNNNLTDCIMHISHTIISVSFNNSLVFSSSYDVNFIGIEFEEQVAKTSLFSKEKIIRGCFVISENKHSPWFVVSFLNAIRIKDFISDFQQETLRAKIENQNKQLEDLNAKIEKQNKNAKEAFNHIQTLETKNAQLEATVLSLKKQNEKLSDIRNKQSSLSKADIAFNSVLHDISKFSDNMVVSNNNPALETTAEGITLSKEQTAAINAMESSSDNFFVTGKAGTGKSVVLRHFVNTTKKNVAVLAPTGIAALNVKGATIHSFFGLKNEVINVDEIEVSDKKKESLKNVDTIIIDEISMVRVDVFDAIDVILKQVHENSLPFGGCQIIVFGDLYQLPPIVEKDTSVHEFLLSRYSSFFFFGTKLFKTNPFRIINLTQVFRQNNPMFIDLLNRIRIGDVNEYVLKEINKRCLPAPQKESILYLTEKNASADKINKEQMQKLPGEQFTYRATIIGNFGKPSQYPTDEFLRLKVGAQVMMLRNEPNKLWVNGTIGIIAALNPNSIAVTIKGTTHTIDKETWKKYEYEFDSKENKLIKVEVGQFNQFPVKPAYAITIHKSQGKTYDKVILKYDGNAFAAGQTYVALSRCSSYEGLYLEKPLTLEDIKVNQEIVNFMSGR